MTGRKSNPWHKYPTPTHLYWGARVREDAQALTNGIRKHLPNAQLFYSVKTNPLPALLKTLHDSGWGMELVSPGDFALAQKIHPRSMVINSITPDESFYRALLTAPNTAAIHVESLDAANALAAVNKKINRTRGSIFRRKCACPVGVRIHDGNSHFGFQINQEHLAKVSDIFKSSNLAITSLHTHTNNHGGPGTQKKYEDIFSGNLNQLMRAKEILDELNPGVKIRSLDLGGGLDHPEVYRVAPEELARYHSGQLAAPKQKSLGLQESAQAIGALLAARLREHGAADMQLFFEFGRAVASRALDTVLSVQAVKENFYPDADVVTTDGSTALLGPIHRGIHHFEFPGEARSLRRAFIYGQLPHSADWIAQNICAPRLSRGDRIIIKNTGAYFIPLEARFGHGLPAIIDGETGKTLRKRESTSHAGSLYKA